jgi:hypothetical protein
MLDTTLLIHEHLGVPIGKAPIKRCFTCDRPINGNCKIHFSSCEFSCNNVNQLPIGSPVVIGLFIAIYLIMKIKKKLMR